MPHAKEDIVYNAVVKKIDVLKDFDLIRYSLEWLLDKVLEKSVKIGMLGI